MTGRGQRRENFDLGRKTRQHHQAYMHTLQDDLIRQAFDVALHSFFSESENGLAGAQHSGSRVNSGTKPQGKTGGGKHPLRCSPSLSRTKMARKHGHTRHLGTRSFVHATRIHLRLWLFFQIWAQALKKKRSTTCDAVSDGHTARAVRRPLFRMSYVGGSP